MKVELFIAKRLRLGRPESSYKNGDGRQKQSPAVGIAIGGIALAVAIMLATLAIVTGFQSAIRGKVMGFEPSIQLQPLGKVYAEESAHIELSPNLLEAIHSAAPKASVALSISQPVVLKTPENFAGLTIRAFGEGHDLLFEKSNIIDGVYPDNDNELAISKLTADKLQLKVGDKVDGCFFIDNSLRLRRFTISGIFSSNFADFDKLTAYSTFPTMARLRHLTLAQGDAIDINGLTLDEVKATAERLQSVMQQQFANGEISEGMFLTTVIQTGAAYLGWLDLLDSNVVVILIIMTLVSGFTLVSCMFILILQRVRMIGILKSLGASNGFIRRIFLMLGGRIILFGLLAGNGIGLTLLLLQQKFHFLHLDPTAYYLDSVPVQLTLHNVFIVNAGALVISFVIMLIPASLVARISPAKTVRYE